ncbi:MAG: hypothetical protein AAGU11_00860, partial [Syntrophobacteraceae bacterium]
GRDAALELFEMELHKVLENIMDPNTDVKTVRKVNLEVSLTPDESREYSKVKVKCKSSLAPTNTFETLFYIGKKNGEPVATEYDPRQMRTFDQPATPKSENVVPFNNEGGIQ